MDKAKLTVEQLGKFARAEKQNGARAKANMAKVQKSADALAKAAKAVAEVSSKNPEL